MKPAPFDYVRPTTIADAVRHLSDSKGEGKVLAGGQSLVPLLNFRLASPRLLVDLNRVAGLSYITLADDELLIGSMTRTRDVERDATVRRLMPVLSDATSWIGHVQIRNRGTVGGSIAHADPAAELPALTLLLDGSITIAGPAGQRTLPAEDLYLGFLTTTLAEDEIVTEVRLHVPASEATWGFHEFAQRHGDFALAGAAVLLTPDAEGKTREARVVVFGGPDRALRSSDGEAALIGTEPTPALIKHAADLAATQSLSDDPRPDAPYRRQVTAAMVSRALSDAVDRRTHL